MKHPTNPPVKDSENMSKYILELIKEESLRFKSADISRSIAVNELDSRFCAERHLDVFTSIVPPVI